MLTNYPTSIVVHGVALNVTVQTYNESLDIGIIACAQAMPEVDEFAAHVESAFLEFQALPVAEQPAAPPATRVPAKKKLPARKAVARKPAAKPVAKATTARRAKRASR
jgi:hypothetical protein